MQTTRSWFHSPLSVLKLAWVSSSTIDDNDTVQHLPFPQDRKHHPPAVLRPHWSGKETNRATRDIKRALHFQKNKPKIETKKDQKIHLGAKKNAQKERIDLVDDPTKTQLE